MFEILGGLLLATAISGIIPLINAEILVVAAAASAPTVGVPLIAAASTVGQMSTKTMLFIVARWAPSRLPRKAQRALAKVSRAVEARGGVAGSLVFMSAAVGLPPYLRREPSQWSPRHAAKGLRGKRDRRTSGAFHRPRMGGSPLRRRRAAAHLRAALLCPFPGSLIHENRIARRLR